MDLFDDCRRNIILAQEHLKNLPNHQIKILDNNLSVAFLPIIPAEGFSIYAKPTPDGFREFWYFLIKDGIVISCCHEYTIDCKVFTLEEYRGKGFTKQFIRFLYKNYMMPKRVTCLDKRVKNLFKGIKYIGIHIRTEEDLKFETEFFLKYFK